MFINKKLILISTVGLALGMSSCKKYLDVNTNPNISQTATVQTLLPAAQLNLGTGVGVDLQIQGSFWAQYWTQTPTASQYVAVDRFAVGQDAYQYSWSNLYAGAENFYQLAKLADSIKKSPYQAIALLMQAYTFQVITDGWGDVPFTEALKGQYVDGHNVNPKYDSQRVVYNGILSYIDSANRVMAKGGVAPGTDDLIYGGDMTKWTKFSNTLKLKVLLRMAKVEPVRAQALIDSLYSTSPEFIGEGDDAAIKYGSTTTNKNPLHAEASSTTLAGTQNLAGSSTCIDAMNLNGDPRVYLFYEYSATTGTVSGITQAEGTYNASIPASAYNFPSIYVGGDAQNAESAKAPVNLLTSWESLFLQAEVVARGWQSSSSGYADDSLFYFGIKANFDYPFYKSALTDIWSNEIFGTVTPYEDYLSGAATGGGTPGPWVVYPATGSVEDKIKFIITQKYFAMCGNQGFEAWSEWRRTGYPDFLINPKNSLIGNDHPRRFLYPTTESTTNAAFPGVKSISTRVWWDVL